jgi:hypothetical protein
LVSFGHCIVCPVLRRLITTLVSFGHGQNIPKWYSNDVKRDRQYNG